MLGRLLIGGLTHADLQLAVGQDRVDSGLLPGLVVRWLVLACVHQRVVKLFSRPLPSAVMLLGPSFGRLSVKWGIVAVASPPVAHRVHDVMFLLDAYAVEFETACDVSLHHRNECMHGRQKSSKRTVAGRREMDDQCMHSDWMTQSSH